MCRKLPGIGECRPRRSASIVTRASHAAVGMLCPRHEGVCPVCDSFVRPHKIVRICDECDYGSLKGSGKGRCVICGYDAEETAYYCYECCVQEKDVRTMVVLWPVGAQTCAASQRDGCPKIVNVGQTRTSTYYAKSRYGFKAR
jgi:PHD finger-like domain-containing protein 5A